MAKIDTSDWSVYRVKYRLAHKGDSPVIKNTTFIIAVSINDVVADMNRYFEELSEEDDDFSFGTVDSIKLITESDIFITKEAEETGLN